MRQTPPLAPLPRTFPASEAAREGGGAPLGDLPEWNLDDLYPGMDSPELRRDLDWARNEAAAFAADLEGRLAALDGAGLAEAVRRYEKLQQVLGRIMSYAGLLYYQNTADPARAKFMGDMQEEVTRITTPLVFFTLELNRIDDEALARALADPELARYKPWLDRLRAFRPYQLSDELEKFLHDQSVVGAAAWNRLFDETMARLTFEVEGEELPLEATLTLLSDADRGKRAAAAAALSEVFAQNLPLFVRITNTLVKEKEIEDRWRKLPTPQMARHLSNQVEPEVVQALRDAVVAAYPRLSHRYYALKARWLGLDKLQHWDRNAPLPEEEDRKIPWDEARRIVLEAYADFSPRMAELAEPFFDKGWIDAPVKPGKAPGAFAHPTVTDVHPYVMLNYLGKTRDVMTLAHELGHGVHQRLAAAQGELLSSTPLTLAETASVFGEMLTFRKLLAAQTDPRRRKALLAGKVEDMINTVVRQIAFYDFESRVHEARREGELTAERIGRIWLDVQSESLGPAFEFAPGYENFWTYVPHFIHSPFYVYAYAFGDGLVNALYAVYEEGDPDFERKYFDLLAAGGAKSYRELLAPFGLDASDPGFWDKGLGLIASMIDELEAMEG
ncbi:M3 family oligoendopeptidase [Oceanicella actignis]|uniref:Oligoendopeptidase F n=1 Tax=Oceanicella actignis TaxID=1189325 RepID=A0A1M7S901_9RHOB|nr:M3 family oligoendopeptidase [Oceanicella actignis]SET31468.1 oligoendopeptidase F [Oceanicella actignis]SHN54956.1 oligoendopeptidase F [Oceanicella actignis]